MPNPRADNATMLLTAVTQGDESASGRLFSMVYDELRRLADVYLKHERAGHTLQATALVHEAFIKLVDETQVEQADRNRFFAMAATAMRRVLIDHARTRNRLKRSGNRVWVTLDEVARHMENSSIDLLALDEALLRLAELDAMQSRLVDLRFFAGLSVEQAAQTLEISERTAHREWVMAKAWLKAEIRKGDEE